MVTDLFNFKVVHFKDYDEIHYFDSGIEVNNSLLIDDDGVIHKKEKEVELIYNPFTEQYEPEVSCPEDREDFYRYLSYKRSLNKIIKLCNYNKPWDLFVTFTFSPKKVDRYSYDECASKLSQWLKDIKKRLCNDVKYIVVPEQHKDGAWHFHGLFGNCSNLNLVDSGLIDNSGRTIYNLFNYKLGFTTATKLTDEDRAISYVTKYIKKDLFYRQKGKKKYWHSRNVVMPDSENFIFETDKMELLKIFNNHIQYITGSGNDFSNNTYIKLDCKLDEVKEFPLDKLYKY